MFPDLKKTIDALRGSSNIGVFCKSIRSLDKAMSIIALSELCKNEGKAFTLMCIGKVRADIEKIFQDYGIVLSKEARSPNYTVSIDYGNTKIDKVVCNRDEGSNKLNFVITPGDDLFSFDNVDLIPGGKNFDLLFAFGIKSLDNLEEDFKEVFSESQVVSVVKTETEIGNYKFTINGSKSYSEVFYEFVKGFSSNLSEEILEILLKGVVARYRLFEKDNSDGWLLVSNFVRYGANLTKVLHEMYYSKGIENFELQKKVMENICFDKENRVVWSCVQNKDLKSCIEKGNLDLRGRIIFNISSEFDIAFVLYHLDENNIKVIIESNKPDKYSAIKLARIFNGGGTDSKAVCSNKGFSGQDFSNRFVEAFEDIFEIKISI